MVTISSLTQIGGVRYLTSDFPGSWLITACHLLLQVVLCLPVRTK